MGPPKPHGPMPGGGCVLVIVFGPVLVFASVGFILGAVLRHSVSPRVGVLVGAVAVCLGVWGGYRLGLWLLRKVPEEGQDDEMREGIRQFLSDPDDRDDMT